MPIVHKYLSVVALSVVLSTGVNAETFSNSTALKPTMAVAQGLLPAGSEELTQFAELDQLAATMGVDVQINEIRINKDQLTDGSTHAQIASCTISGTAGGITITVTAATCAGVLSEFRQTANEILRG